MTFKQNNQGVFVGAAIALLFFTASYFLTPLLFSFFNNGTVQDAYALVFKYGNVVQEKIFSLSAIGFLLPFYYFFKKTYYKQAYGCIMVALFYSIAYVFLYL